MEHARYHLVFEGFKPDTNKTAVSFSLKDQLALSDSQINDMMSGRRTVLKQNMNKEEAQKLGRELTQAGLIIKAQALAVNQKNSPEDVRKHLLNGGIEQYFASKYRHPEDELDTRFSLIILAAFAVVTYLLLPLIGLFILRPLLNASIWSGQFIPALIQLLIGAVFFIPAIILRPRPVKVEGIYIEPDTEELIWRLTESLADHLSAQTIDNIVLVDSPVLNVHQTPKQWMANRCTLEIGLPVLESLNLQQFVGLLAIRMTPRASKFYRRTWGLFIQWYLALRSVHKPTALLLNNWVLPMYEHQNERAQKIARDLVGLAESQRLQRIEKRFTELERDWPEFVDYCQKLRIRGTGWASLVSKETRSEKKADEQLALFRIESPAIWALSTTDGYQKAISRQLAEPAYTMPGQQLWQQFQRYIPLADRFNAQMIKPEALIPPSGPQKKKKRPNALLLNRQAQEVLNTQKQMIEESLGMHEKPKKTKDVQKLIDKWRTSSSAFWPEDAQTHKLFPIAKSAFLALQSLQQIELWNIADKKLPKGKGVVRDRQIVKLHLKWLEQISKLPALPQLPDAGNKLSLQVQAAHDNLTLNELTAAEILEQHDFWKELNKAYWVFLAGQILKPKTLADEAEDIA